MERSLNVLEIKKYLRNNLKIVTGHKGSRLEIKLMLEGSVISFDYIDYSDVVHVVEQSHSNPLN